MINRSIVIVIFLGANTIRIITRRQNLRYEIPKHIVAGIAEWICIVFLSGLFRFVLLCFLNWHSPAYHHTWAFYIKAGRFGLS